ncbi:DUF805 domain-containing protein [Frisingicoccus sp.]|uniref:DUF805 domain-containing protein n=1 Tax=Frisingicoccus sp. TaxID=1918627 RepID=UPI002A811E97|nr:DUF805 domain-containing protein [Frisingicoccus sp.]MDY4923460.1 DUF805 domain-containing protein [Frisingicoccus sp.]
MRKCTKCGHMAENVWFCSECGEPMEEIKEQSDRESQGIDAGGAEKKGFFTYPITRKQYWLRVIAFYVAGTIVGLIMDVTIGGFYISPEMYFPARNIIYMALFVLLIVLQVLRWHDANKSGLFALINFIPIVGPIIAFIIPGCLKSNYENNKWIL